MNFLKSPNVNLSDSPNTVMYSKKTDRPEQKDTIRFLKGVYDEFGESERFTLGDFKKFMTDNDYKITAVNDIMASMYASGVVERQQASRRDRFVYRMNHSFKQKFKNFMETRSKV